MAAVTICSDFGAPQNKSAIMLLIIREMQIKTAMRYHLTLVRMAIIKKSAEGVEKREDILERVWRKGNPLALLVGM